MLPTELLKRFVLYLPQGISAIGSVDSYDCRVYNRSYPTLIKKVFPVLAAAIFSAMLGMGAVTPLLPLYAQNMGASGTIMGIIFAAYGISNTVLTPVMGSLSDRKGRRLLICLGLFVFSTLSLGYIFATNPLHLVLTRVVQGVAGAMVIPTSLAYIGDISPAGEEGKWMGYANAAFFSGFGVGPLLGGVLSERWGMNYCFYTLGGLCFLSFLLVVFFLPDNKPKRMAGKGGLSLRDMSASNPIKGVATIRLVQTFARASIMTFLPFFAATYAGLDSALIGVLVSVDMLFTTLLAAPAGRLSDRFNRNAIVILGNVIFLTSVAVIPLTHNFWQLLLLSVPRGAGTAISMNSAQAITVTEGRKFGMGSTMAIVMMAEGLGVALGPILSGVISDMTSVHSVFILGAVLGIVGTVLFSLFSRGRLGNKLLTK